MNRLYGWFAVLNMVKCGKCGCRHTVSRDHQYLDVLDNGMGPLLEFEEVCANCGTPMNYWAYGHYAEPTTYTEMIRFRWAMFKINARYHVWRFFK